MKKTAGLLLCASFAVSLCAARVHTQIKLQPTPEPRVTAENEPWFQMREPVIFAGEYYYPGGPAIHFLANEMVPSGLYRGVPMYSRTTIEPNSVVFVPIGGGMMQPYERRRTGDLVGTTGSAVPSLPVDMSPTSSAPRTDSSRRSARRLVAARRGTARRSLCIGLAGSIARDRQSVGRFHGLRRAGQPFAQRQAAQG